MGVNSSELGSNLSLNTEVLQLRAPLSGPLVALEEVPDPVFAQKMVGDGISIDPTDYILRAPCDGEIIQLHRAHHALTILSANNIEVMIHIGIDTVALDGAGFQIKVSLGDKVHMGDALIEFDADFVATKVKSLLTQVIITNGDMVKQIDHKKGYVTAGNDIILTLHMATNPDEKTAVSDLKENIESLDECSLASAFVTIPNPTGLHARPAAMLVAKAKTFSSSIALHKGERSANAKSLVSIMALETSLGDEVCLKAEGVDAHSAIDALSEAIQGGLGEVCGRHTASCDSDQERALDSAHRLDDRSSLGDRPSLDNVHSLMGAVASPGLAIGFVHQLVEKEFKITQLGEGAEVETQRLRQSLTIAYQQLEDVQSSMDDKEKSAIFVAHQELLDDPALLETAHELIAKGKSAAFAWQHAFVSQSDTLSKLKNALLAARANDLRDVGRRVLRLILGVEEENTSLSKNCILIAEDLTPSQTANIDRTKVLGFCTVTGGASSHVAILARSLNLPAIAGIDRRALLLNDGAEVILDASHGQLQLNPNQDDIARIQKAKVALDKKRVEDMANAHKPAKTQCGQTLELVANVGRVDDVHACVKNGGEGVGLCRSEFLFMNRPAAPSEDEQFDIYYKMAMALKKDQPLVIRSLDVGGDKPLPYLPIAAEENPFLGLRGIRVCLLQPQIFRIQLRAILRAAAASKGVGAKVMLMFPMVTSMNDLVQAKILLEEERNQLGVDVIPVGIMVEVPTTAMMAEQFAKEVDFFSIGTNDLTQYALAMDRGHPILASQADGLNPGVLALIANTVKGAHKHGAWVGVCGGIASDAIATPILLGLGVDELSVSVPSVPEIKAAVRVCNVDVCKTLAQKTLEQNNGDDVRALVASAYPELV